MTEEQLNDLRRRIDSGEEVSNDEILAGLQAIRTARLNAAASAGNKSKSVTVAPIKLDLATLIAKKHSG